MKNHELKIYVTECNDKNICVYLPAKQSKPLYGNIKKGYVQNSKVYHVHMTVI